MAKTFEEVWAEKEREGYSYGEDALEQVRFGWELAQLAAAESLAASQPSQGGADGREVFVVEDAAGRMRGWSATEADCQQIRHLGDRVVRYVPAESRQQQESGWVPVEGVVPRASVRWFAEQMELALQRNDHKGGWHECDPLALARRVGQELKELRDALKAYGPPACACREAGCPHARLFASDEATIIGEAADVGAMAMMVAEHFRPGGPSLDQGQSLPPPPAEESKP